MDFKVVTIDQTQDYMKHLFLLVAAVMAFATCTSNSTDRYADQINSLSKDWNATTTAATDFAKTLKAEVETWKDMYAGMYAEKSFIETLTEEQQQRLNELKTTCAGHGELYKNMAAEVDQFVKDWSEDSKKMAKLREGLESRYLPPALTESIDPLRKKMETAQQQISQWQETLASTKESCFDTCGEYASIVEGSES